MARRYAVLLPVLLLLSAPSLTSVVAEPDGDLPEQLHLALSGDASQMIITWVTATHADGGVEWGRAASDLNQSAEGSNHTYDADDWSGVIHDAPMSDLAAGTEYHYRVGDDEAGWSAVHSFRTSPSDASRVRIGVIADMDETDAARDVVAAMSSADLDLVLFSGDVSYAYDSTRFWDEVDGEEWDDWGRLYERVSAEVPTMFAVGNHENEEQDGCEGCGFKAYLSRVNMPNSSSESDSEFWYSFNFSLFHIISLSSEHDYTTGSAQRTWLAADLATADADREAHPWLVVMFHRPMYSSSESGHGSELDLREALESLLVEHRVDLVLTGHDHDYERTYPVNATKPTQTDTNAFVDAEAPIHLVVGTGGRILYGGSSSEPTWSASFTSTTHGYGVLELLDRESLQFTFYDDEHGDVLDVFTLSRNGSVEPEHTAVPTTGSSMLSNLFDHPLIAGLLLTLVLAAAVLLIRVRATTASAAAEAADDEPDDLLLVD